MEDQNLTTTQEDSFDAEVEAIRRNQELLELLDERGCEKEGYTLEQVREKLGLT